MFSERVSTRNRTVENRRSLAGSTKTESILGLTMAHSFHAVAPSMRFGFQKNRLAVLECILGPAGLIFSVNEKKIFIRYPQVLTFRDNTKWSVKFFTFILRLHNSWYYQIAKIIIIIQLIKNTIIIRPWDSLILRMVLSPLLKFPEFWLYKFM